MNAVQGKDFGLDVLHDLNKELRNSLTFWRCMVFVELYCPSYIKSMERMKRRTWRRGGEMEEERGENRFFFFLKRGTITLLPVWDSRLGDSRPGRPGCSSLGLSWIPAPEQRFGGRPGRELEGERQRDGWHRITSTALSTERWRDDYCSC